MLDKVILLKESILVSPPSGIKLFMGQTLFEHHGGVDLTTNITETQKCILTIS